MWGWRRRPAQIGNVTFITIVGAVERQGTAIQTDNPQRDTEKRRSHALWRQRSRKPDREQIPDEGMPCKDRPFDWASVEQIIKT
jgi:hypothetical protein